MTERAQNLWIFGSFFSSIWLSTYMFCIFVLVFTVWVEEIKSVLITNNHDPSDLGWLILIGIISKERTLCFRILRSKPCPCRYFTTVFAFFLCRSFNPSFCCLSPFHQSCFAVLRQCRSSEFWPYGESTIQLSPSNVTERAILQIRRRQRVIKFTVTYTWMLTRCSDNYHILYTKV